MNKREYLPGDTRTRINDLIAERKMSVSALAEAIGCDETSLGRYLRGDTKKISAEQLAKISEIFNVSLDFLMGVTEITDRLGFELADLGLSVKAAQNLYTGAVDAKVVNLLLENELFARLTTVLSHYFDDTFVSAFAAQNQMYGMLSAMMLDINNGKPGQTAAKDIDTMKTQTSQAELEEIERNFSLVVKDIKRDIVNAVSERPVKSTVLTKDIMKDMRRELLKGKDKKRLKNLTPQDIADAVAKVTAKGQPFSSEQIEAIRNHSLALMNDVINANG